MQLYKTSFTKTREKQVVIANIVSLYWQNQVVIANIVSLYWQNQSSIEPWEAISVYTVDLLNSCTLINLNKLDRSAMLPDVYFLDFGLFPLTILGLCFIEPAFFLVAWKNRKHVYSLQYNSSCESTNLMYKLVGFFKDIFLGIQLLSGLGFLSRPMTSDFEGFPTKLLSITFLSYLNSWEKGRSSQ